MSAQILEEDVLIIGAGGAGLRAAIEAHDQGAKVIVITKTLPGKAHTVMAEGGVAASLGNLDSQDNWKIHFRDTWEEGRGIGNPKMIEILCKEAPERIRELEKWGAIFDRSDEGKILQRPFGAHSYRRVCHVGDRTGIELMQTLLSQVRKRKIKILDETIATKIFVKENKALGAATVDLREGKFIVIKAKAIILATGGLGRIYQVTSNSWESSGDGFSLAYNAGAELRDMEMVQFHPTGMLYPENVRGILITESVRGEGGILLNAQGERFMQRYDKKRMELSARDIVAKAIFNEVKEGKGTSRGGVYLDISHKPKNFILKKLPKMAQQLKDFADLDLTKEKVEVYPTAHYMMGGVKVKATTGETSVKGLFAAGEVASGVHGANRLGGNSLADILVFGRRAGKFAAKFSQGKKLESLSKEEIEGEYEKVMKPFKVKEGLNPVKLKKKIREVMWKYVGLERNEKGLRKALKLIEEIKKQGKKMSVKGNLIYNLQWLTFLEVKNMLITAEAIIRSALARKESRGAHQRSDYPNEKKKLFNIICKKDKGKMRVIKKIIQENGKSNF